MGQSHTEFLFSVASLRFFVFCCLCVLSYIYGFSTLCFNSGCLKNIQGDVPKWLMGPLSKSGRGLKSPREFESLHLRQLPAVVIPLLAFSMLYAEASAASDRVNIPLMALADSSCAE